MNVASATLAQQHGTHYHLILVYTVIFIVFASRPVHLYIDALQITDCIALYCNSKGPLMTTNMLHNIKHNIKHSIVLQS